MSLHIELILFKNVFPLGTGNFKQFQKNFKYLYKIHLILFMGYNNNTCNS